MNICLISDYYEPFAIGGAELSTQRLAEELVCAGHRVSVVTPHYGSSAYEQIKGVDVYRAPFPQRLTSGQQARSCWAHNILLQLHMAWFIRGIGRRERFEVIHAVNTNVIIAGFYAARLLKKRFIVSIRDYRLLDDGPSLWINDNETQVAGTGFFIYLKKGLAFERFFDPASSPWRRIKVLMDLIYRWPFMRLTRRCFQKADTIIAVSNSIRDFYVQHDYPALAGKIIVTYNLAPAVTDAKVDEHAMRKSYGLSPDKPIILWAGRKTPAKGFDCFCEAITQCDAAGLQACYVAAGRGHFAEGHRVRDVVDMAMVSNDELLRLIAISRVVVAPSAWHEPLSRLIIEALSLARPVISTPRGGTPEMIIDSINGFLIPPGDSALLAARITELVEDETLWKHLSRQASETACTMFSAATIIRCMERIYQGALAHDEAGLTVPLNQGYN